MSRSRTSSAPLWTPRGAGGLRIDFRLALLPVSFAVLAVATLVLAWPVPVLIALAVGMPLFGLAVQRMTSRAYRAFERRFNLALASGDRDELVSLVKNAWWLRTFGPRDRMLARHGLVLSMHGAWRAAEQTLEDAWMWTRASDRAGLLGPIARVKLELDAWDELATIAHQWSRRAGRLPGPAMYQAAVDAVLERTTIDEAREIVRTLADEGGATDRTLADAIDAKLVALEAEAAR